MLSVSLNKTSSLLPVGTRTHTNKHTHIHTDTDRGIVIRPAGSVSVGLFIVHM